MALGNLSVFGGYNPASGYSQSAAQQGTSGYSVTLNGGVDDADEAYAQIAREEYEDYVQNYQPFEDFLIDSVLDDDLREGLRSEAMGFVRDSTTNAFKRSQRSLDQRDRRQGVRLSKLESDYRNRGLQSHRQLALAKGLTDMTRHLNERELKTMSGGI